MSRILIGAVMKSIIKITRQGCDEYGIDCGRVRVLQNLRRHDLESIRDQVVALLAEHDGKNEPKSG